MLGVPVVARREMTKEKSKHADDGSVLEDVCRLEDARAKPRNAVLRECPECSLHCMSCTVRYVQAQAGPSRREMRRCGGQWMATSRGAKAWDVRSEKSKYRPPGQVQSSSISRIGSR